MLEDKDQKINYQERVWATQQYRQLPYKRTGPQVQCPKHFHETPHKKVLYDKSW